VATPVVASLEQKKVMILRPITQYFETENTRKTKTDATKIWTRAAIEMEPYKTGGSDYYIDFSLLSMLARE
jgi:hypothetical protein